MKILKLMGGELDGETRVLFGLEPKGHYAFFSHATKLLQYVYVLTKVVGICYHYQYAGREDNNLYDDDVLIINQEQSHDCHETG